MEGHNDPHHNEEVEQNKNLSGDEHEEGTESQTYPEGNDDSRHNEGVQLSQSQSLGEESQLVSLSQEQFQSLMELAATMEQTQAETDTTDTTSRVPILPSCIAFAKF